MDDPEVYHRFEAGKACFQLAEAVYAETRSWPREEIYGITSQVRRAAFSASLNLAEGAAKRGSRELRRYVDISLGSLSELQVALHLARRVGILPLDRWSALNELLQRAGKLTGGLARSLRSP
jgi:four helix bundle protein